MKDTGGVLRKVSLASLDNFGLASIKLKKEESKDEAPRDVLFFVDMLFFLKGLMHYIPFTFFITANAYWMYKFRDVNADITDTNARTWLQTHFSPVNNIVSMTCGPITVLTTTFYGFKVKSRIRVLIVLSALSIFFIAGTVFVHVNTESWQTLFFIITMIILMMISISNAAFSTANMTILSRFPHRYMKVYLVGGGFGGVCSASLQILSLALGTTTETSALFYFGTGSVLMMATLILYFFSKYNKTYQYHANSVVEDVTKDVLTLSEAKDLAKQIWAPITAYILCYITLVPVAPNITSLVVSEYYGSGSEWSDKYFVPVITFLFSDTMGLMGRIAAAKINKPRYHLPVFFHHDWQYILIIAVFFFSNGYVMNMVYLDVAHLVGPEKVEDAYLVMMSVLSMSVVLCFPIGTFSVEIL